MEKEITVMLPVIVPNSAFCHRWDEQINCQHFKSGECGHGFKPRFLKEDGVWMKDKKCMSLIFKENIK